ASPSSVTLSCQPSGSSSTQNLNLTSNSVGLAYTATGSVPSQGWLVVTPSGRIPGSLAVSADCSKLAAGSYTGSIAVTAPGAVNSPLTIGVTLNVTANVLSVTPNPLTFSFLNGGTAPPAQSFSVAASLPGTSFSIAGSAGCSFLNI